LVTLVGAGPGDPDLITVAGLEALRAADVVVYDRLAAPALLQETHADALLVDAGKAPGAHRLDQDGINALLATHARAGRTVVRLKGGDPFVFGRGGEEALYLAERGIPFRVIPGVTSAIAAPAFAGIPVTQRTVAGSFLVITGHDAEDSDGRRTDWHAVARAADTLVFMMGVERLEQIVAALLAAGRPAEQPAALVRWGSTPQQAVVAATLGTIVAAAEARALAPPATLVVGEVVRLRERLAWFESLPLFGARVLVTRTREQARGLITRLRTHGAQPLEVPAIACAPLEDPGALDAALLDLARYHWIVFASANAVQAAFARLNALGQDARAFAGPRICAVGSATAAALAGHGLRADLVPTRFTGEAVVQALGAIGVRGARVLTLRPEIAPPAFVDGLRALGAEVTAVTAYRTTHGANSSALAALLAEGLDAITFTSSSTVTSLLDALGGDTAPLRGALIASIGPSTSATARAAGLRVDTEADPHTLDGLVTALARAWQERRRLEEAHP